MHACVHALTAKWQVHLRVLNITFISVLTKSKVWDNEKCVCVCVCVYACVHTCMLGAVLRFRRACLSCCSVGAVHRPPCTVWDSTPQVPLNELAWHFDQPPSARPGPARDFPWTWRCSSLLIPLLLLSIFYHKCDQRSMAADMWMVQIWNLVERERDRMFCTIFSVTQPIRQQVYTEVLLTPKTVMWFLYRLFCFRMLHWALQGGREDGTGEAGGSTGGPFTPIHRGTSPADSCSLRPRLSEPREGSVEAPSAGGILLDVT